MRTSNVYLFLLLIVGITLLGFESQKSAVFRSPLGIPLLLTGSFMEMRGNHFHSGVDIRTNGQSGYRVYAAADGYVSRVAVASGGFGNALYVTHPSGHTTVYGHLERFESPMAEWVKETQYQRHRFAVSLYPDKTQFPVRQGEVIAYSGNSGSSGGPHLHYEIRDAATSEPLNPLRMGLGVADTTPPRIYRIKVYPRDATSHADIVSGSGRVIARATLNNPAEVDASGTPGGAMKLKDGTVIRGYGKLAFSIQTHDYHEGSNARLGPYEITLNAGTRRLFSVKMDRMNFGETRYLNAHVDYAERTDSRRWFQRSFVLPGNRLPFYETDRDGVLDVGVGDRFPMDYRVVDPVGNTTTLGFIVQGESPRSAPDGISDDGERIGYSRAASIVRPGILIRIPAGALYEDLSFRYEQLPGGKDMYSARHVLHDNTVPVHSAFTVSISADGLPADLQERAVIARETPNGGLASAGGTYENGFVTARTRAFGTYVLVADTTAPKIRPVNIKPGASMARATSIQIKMSDNMSGISSYEGRVDGAWVLFEYDAKRSLLTHTFDGRIGPGSHELVMRVSDGVGNKSVFRAAFSR